MKRLWFFDTPFNTHTYPIFVCVMFLLSACSSTDKAEKLEFSYTSSFVAERHCLWNNIHPDVPIIFEDQTDIDAKNECFQEIGEFDFSDQKLVAIWVRTGGCDYKGSRIIEILMDHNHKTVTFHIEPGGVGNCAEYYEATIWAAIPLLPPEYSILTRFH